ncbi:MAG: hypothetical protein F6K19_50460 [Cyanothece sp. SIO1E1]|nr:hypothetical protein [Cyanothece sp. SIO1E1]
MRVTIEKGFQPLIREVMGLLRTDDPKLAVNHIIGSWAAGQTCPALHKPELGLIQTQSEDEFAAIADWQ